MTDLDDGTTISPEELAKELGRSGKVIRAWLRRQPYPHVHNQPWHLTRDQADAVRAHFGYR